MSCFRPECIIAEELLIKENAENFNKCIEFLGRIRNLNREITELHRREPEHDQDLAVWINQMARDMHILTCFTENECSKWLWNWILHMREMRQVGLGVDLSGTATIAVLDDDG